MSVSKLLVYYWVDMFVCCGTGPVMPLSDMLFLTGKCLRVDRQSSIIRHFREALGKCSTGEGRRDVGISFGEICACWPIVLLLYCAFTVLLVFFVCFIFFSLFTIIVYICTLVLSARTGISYIYNKGLISSLLPGM